MDKQIKEELTKIYEQIGALLSTDESDKIKKFGTLQILGAAVPAPEKPYRKGDVLGYNGTDFGIGDTVPGKEITWLKLGDIWVCDRNILQGISWETLNKKGFVFGKEIEIDNEKYTLRILTGSDGEDYGKGCGNEWDHLADEYDEDNDILHFDNMYSWCQLITTMRPTGRFAAITPRAATIAATRRPRTRSLVGAPSLKN